MSQCEGRQRMVDPEWPWWAKLRRAESLIEGIRHASRRSTEQGVVGDCSGDAEEAVVYRIRLIEPISADFAVLVGDAIRNLRSSLNQVAYRISGAQFDDWAPSKNKQTKLRRSEIFGKRRSGRFARHSRSRSPSG
jgi:hypothetical protein